MIYDTDFQASLSHVPESEIERARESFSIYYSKARCLSFPGYRFRHRLLRNLCGAYPCERPLPEWWREDLPSLIAVEELRTLLARVTSDEFYLGRLSGERACELKHLGQRYEKPPLWARSPRLGKILIASLPKGESDPLYRFYQDRGTKLVGDRTVIVSAHPWDILSMGCSHYFSTCQALDGDDPHAKGYNDRLPANLLDSGMAVAYVPEADDGDRWELERMQARVILRLMRERKGEWGILLDRFYGDRGLCLALEASLVSILGRVHLPRWIPEDYDYGEGVGQRTGQRLICVHGPLQDFKDYPSPYLDQNRYNSSFDWGRSLYRAVRRGRDLVCLTGYVFSSSHQDSSAHELEDQEERPWSSHQSF